MSNSKWLDHDHINQHDIDSEPMSYYQLMGAALTEILIEKNVISADELRRAIEKVDSRSPAEGARVIARAWRDQEYKERLLKNANLAVNELNIDIPDTNLVVVENTHSVHNVIVCTLCSCYPRNLLGLPPDWYKSKAYRSRVVREPRAVLREFGTEFSNEIEIRVHDSTADMRYLVLPQRPLETDHMDLDHLTKLISRDCMIGVALPKSP